MSGLLSITGGRSLRVCRGRAPCRCSFGSSQSSRCVFDKVCSSRISESGTSETSLFLSCEGIVISSSSVGVLNLTLPSSDTFNSPVSCCTIFLVHGENLSSLCTPPCSAEAQSRSWAPKCSGPKKGGQAAETTPGYSLIVYSITEAPPLLQDHKA